MPKKPLPQKSARRIMEDYFFYHNYKEIIFFEDFISEIVPAIAQFGFSDLPTHFEEQLRCEVQHYNLSDFYHMQVVLLNGKWTGDMVKRLAPKPDFAELRSDWVGYWIKNDLKNLEKAYQFLCEEALMWECLTSRKLATIVKTVEDVNKILILNGVDLTSWHKKIENKHRSCSSKTVPYTLITIYENSPSVNAKEFSALNNSKIMEKAAEVLPPVIVGTLQAFKDILGWGVCPIDLPICRISNTAFASFDIDRKGFESSIGQHYKNLQLRLHLIQEATLQTTVSKKRKM